MSGIERTEATDKSGKVTITTKYIVKKDGSFVAIVRSKPSTKQPPPTDPDRGEPTTDDIGVGRSAERQPMPRFQTAGNASETSVKKFAPLAGRKKLEDLLTAGY
jgi:hypothetical protein